jgi:hypothetical protein
MAVLGLAIAIGGLIGLPALHFGGVDIGLSPPVGVLIGGLVVGWLHSRRPIFGRVPDAALSLLNSLGLGGFLALVGIGAGPMFVLGLRTSGLPLLVAGVLVCAIPNIVTPQRIARCELAAQTALALAQVRADLFPATSLPASNCSRRWKTTSTSTITSVRTRGSATKHGQPTFSMAMRTSRYHTRTDRDLSEMERTRTPRQERCESHLAVYAGDWQAYRQTAQ